MKTCLLISNRQRQVFFAFKADQIKRANKEKGKFLLKIISVSIQKRTYLNDQNRSRQFNCYPLQIKEKHTLICGESFSIVIQFAQRKPIFEFRFPHSIVNIIDKNDRACCLSASADLITTK